MTKEEELTKIVYRCSKCGSEDVDGKAWVGLNNSQNIDWSASEGADDKDYYCNKCSEHTTLDIEEEPINWEDTVGEVTYQGIEMSVRITELKAGHTIIFALYDKEGDEVYSKHVCDLEAYK